MDKKEVIREFFAGTNFQVSGEKYHSPLPPELADWYCYTTDGGHSILVLIEGEFDEHAPGWKQLCPAPVKSVMRSYRKIGDFIAAPLEYSSEVGLLTYAEDDEF